MKPFFCVPPSTLKVTSTASSPPVSGTKLLSEVRVPQVRKRLELACLRSSASALFVSAICIGGQEKNLLYFWDEVRHKFRNVTVYV